MNMTISRNLICKSDRTLDDVVNDFWKRVRKGDKSECWEWLAARSSRKTIFGYGIMWVAGKKFKAHQFALALKEKKPDGKWFCCHRCDNPPCCNPNHLFWGTPKDNVQDCIKKGRYNKERGEDRYNATLNEEKVREIRLKYETIKGETIDTLAAKYGVGRTMIFAIIKRTRWKHVK